VEGNFYFVFFYLRAKKYFHFEEFVVTWARR